MSDSTGKSVYVNISEEQHRKLCLLGGNYQYKLTELLREAVSDYLVKRKDEIEAIDKLLDSPDPLPCSNPSVHDGKDEEPPF